MNYDFADQEAERVIKELTETGCGPGCTDWPFIIAEALRKAYQHGQEDESIAYQKVNLPGAFNDGFEAAKEMAAKIVLRDVSGAKSNGFEWVADRLDYMAWEIRTLKPEGE